MNPVLEPLFRTVRATHPKADLRLIERAYDVAAYHHRDQKRKSGDPYITHPLAVATILAELGTDDETLCAALLHDTVEDTAYSLDELRGDFGDTIGSLVDGVTKLDKVKFGDAAQAETVRKMVVAMSRDIRVLIIKLADRLHNMRTMRYLPEHKRHQKSRETLEIFAPLAHRLGMNTIKWELEDLAFAMLYPKRYDEIARMVSERAPRRDLFLQEVIEKVHGDLREAKIRAVVKGRPKHYYSVYQKMIARDVAFDDIYDLVGIRVLVDSVRDCYAALGTIHARWNPVPGRFKDYIAMPKFNMYQSLHTTVIGPEGKPVELQIRTHAMHHRAEYGVAAHWKYKEEVGAPGPTGKVKPGSDMAWLRQLLDWQKETSDPGEFLESLRFDLSVSEVYVFTPKGQVIALPEGATPVDFAYAVHTEVGHRCIGARVNGRLVPLESRLGNGDTVEIFTSKSPDAGPSRDWLKFVKSGRARNKIRQWFSKERRETAIEAGKEAIGRAMRKQGLPLQRLMSGEALLALARDLRYPDVSALYAAVGEGHIAAQAVVQKLVASIGGVDSAEEDIAETARPSPWRWRRRRGGGGRRRRLGTPVEVLHPGARRRDRRFRHPGPRRVGAPGRLHQRAAAQVAAGPPGGGELVAERRQRVPGGHPGGGARPAAAAVGRHPYAVGPARQHPQRLGDDVARPGGDQQVHLRDGRPEAPGPRAQGRAQHPGRVRRLPGERRGRLVLAQVGQVDHDGLLRAARDHHDGLL
jgi:GTP pyrophosphokinase